MPTCTTEHTKQASSFADTVTTPKIDDFPDEFYIVLSGEVGIFPPRLDELMLKESNVLETVKTVMKNGDEPLNAEIESILNVVDMNRFNPEEKEFLHHIKRIKDNKIVFKNSYLTKKLGNLPDSALELPEFYHHVNEIYAERNSEV